MLVDQLHDCLGAMIAMRESLLALIERLAADVHELAGHRHSQPLNELLRDDLSKGFFTTRTP